MNRENSSEMTAITFRLPKDLHEELQRAARRRGVSQNTFVRESLGRAVLGCFAKPADRTSLSTVIWISEYLMRATKHDQEEVDRLWEIAENKADAILG